MNRRDAIKALGTALGAASASKLLAACGDNAGAGAEVGITHYVFMMMENRSYDHYFGARALIEGRGGDGLTADMANPDLDGNPVGIFEGDPMMLCVQADPPHGWNASRTQLGGGANDGFVIAHQEKHGAGPIDPMAYLTRPQLPVSYALADAYTSCDRWFCSVLGPTLPNRMYWHAATSNGAQANDEVLGGAFKGVTSIYHRLEAAGIDWAYYYGDIPVLAFVEGIDKDGKLRRYTDFMIDAANGDLPPVTYIDPAFSYNDDHPPHHPLLGQQLIASVYQALATSPLWNNVLLVITYDENGGFFDHVAPPTVPDDNAALGFDQLGFRVPALVAGPYVKSEYVSSVEYDHTSALKHLESQLGLEPLTARDAAAADLTDCIDLERLAAGEPRPPIELPPVDINVDDVPDDCIGGGLERRHGHHDILEWAAANPEMIGEWDLSDQTEDMIYEIAAYLDGYQLGRIKGR